LDVAEQIRRAVSSYYADFAETLKPRQGLSRLLKPAADKLRMLVARMRLRSDMRTAVRQAHVDAARSVVGDATLTPVDMVAINVRVDREYVYLEGFLSDIPTMNEAEAQRRAALYLNAAAQTGSIIAAIELPTLPVYPGSYQLACNGFCRCHLRVEALDGEGNWDVWWVVDTEAEHCSDCVALSAEWSPLRIRNGEILSVITGV